MAVSLNHSIVHARDPEATARFLTEMLGPPPARRLAHFTVVQVGETSLDCLMSEPESDAVLARLQARGLPYWADPFRREAGRINHCDDGRGVYFDDPNGRLLEAITHPYGSGGADAEHPNPLLSR